MILCISDVLDASALARLRETIAGGVFVDGILSSGWASRLVKNNEQLGAGPALEAAQEQVVSALRAMDSLCCSRGWSMTVRGAVMVSSGAWDY